MRLFKESDLDAYAETMNKLEARGDHLPLHILNPVDLKKQFGENGMMDKDRGRFLIEEIGTGRIVGDVGFFRGTHYTNGYEIGYGIHSDEDRGKGYCAEAIRILTKWIFNTKEINRLQICMDVDNIGSKRVAEKCGYKYEGMLRGVVYSRGEYRDLYIYGMTREDHKACAL